MFALPDPVPNRRPAPPAGSDPGSLPAAVPTPAPLDSTAALLSRLRAGDLDARERLLGRYLPVLQRWAHGRLPRYGRDLAETDDLVQQTLIRALNRLEEFDPRRDGAFLAYLRRILLNGVRDEIRKTRRRPERDVLGEWLEDALPSPLQEAIGAQTLAAYEAAVACLPEPQQTAVVLHVEMGLSNAEIADAIASPSPNAARMHVARGLERLAEEMQRGKESKE